MKFALGFEQLRKINDVTIIDLTKGFFILAIIAVLISISRTFYTGWQTAYLVHIVALLLLNTCKRLIESINRPIIYHEIEFLIGVSIGCALFPEHTTDTETLRKKADKLMYDVKN